jgi:hypothetical protein
MTFTAVRQARSGDDGDSLADAMNGVAVRYETKSSASLDIQFTENSPPWSIFPYWAIAFSRPCGGAQPPVPSQLKRFRNRPREDSARASLRTRATSGMNNMTCREAQLNVELASLRNGNILHAVQQIDEDCNMWDDIAIQGRR